MKIRIDIRPIIKKIDQIIQDLKREEQRPLIYYCFQMSYLIACKEMLMTMLSSTTEEKSQTDTADICHTIENKINEIEDLLNSFCKEESPT